MIWILLLEAVKFNCLTSQALDRRVSKRSLKLVERYYEPVSGSFEEGIQQIFNELSSDSSTNFNENTQTVEFPVNWVHMNSFSSEKANQIISYLNRFYQSNGIPISFTLLKGAKIDSATVTASDEKLQYELFLEHGNKKSNVLNIFSIISDKNEKQIDGWTLMPSVGQYSDAIFINENSIEHSDEDLAKVLAHESGHWLGLFHVFEGGCGQGPGDYVTDTPKVDSNLRSVSESSGILQSFEWQCDAQMDTCRAKNKKKSLDLLTNVMDYTDCKSTMTLGQGYRVMSFAYHRIKNTFPIN
eukprot:NODE_388_length_9508_cov_0.225954.p6 type:complete len:299 gc:universal NODE_388_length_9508_cov_0.225954:4299-3403(-)